MALANVAWIIASSGKRVLIVDWDLESPGLHKFFHPFLEESKVERHPGRDRAHQRLRHRGATSYGPRSDDWYRNAPGSTGTPSPWTGTFPGRRASSTSCPPDGRTATTRRPSARWTGTTSTSAWGAAGSSALCATT